MSVMRGLPVRVLGALAGGVAAGLAFEPLALAYLLPVAVALLTLACASVSLLRGFLLGSVFGAAFMLVLLPWLQVIGTDAWITLSLIEALFYGLAGLGTVAVRRLPAWPLWAASAWVGVELLRGTVPFGGFPWGRLAFATIDTPAAASFAYVGAAGVTFLVALVGTTLAWAAETLRRRPVASVAALAGACVAASAASATAVNQPEPNAEYEMDRVAAVQGNVPGEGLDAFAEQRAVLDNHVEATLELAQRIEAGRTARPQLVVWPENSTDIDPFADPTVRADIQRAVDAVGVPVLVGALSRGPDQRGGFRNVGIVWSPEDGPGETYTKRHLVPFGEYIPLRDVLRPYIGRLEMVGSEKVAGTKPGVLSVNGVTLGDVICFEVAYDDVVRDAVPRGTDMLVVQTNNATYMGTGQVEQQFAISRLRAIGTGRPVVVAATNGVTGVIAPTGKVVDRVPVRTQAVAQASVFAVGRPPALLLGRPVELLLAGISAIAVLAGLVLGYRRRRPAYEPGDEERETVART